MLYEYNLFEFVDGFMQLWDLRQVQWSWGSCRELGWNEEALLKVTQRKIRTQKEMKPWKNKGVTRFQKEKSGM